MSNRSRLILVGAGSLARELIGWMNRTPSIAAIIADGEPTGKLAKRVVSTIDGFTPFPGDQFMVAIADTPARERITRLLVERGARPVSWHHETCVFGGCTLRQGTLTMPHSIIAADVEAGDGLILNCASSCGHDVRIGNFVTVSAHVDICGGVKIGDRVFIGSGARILPGVEVGNDARIGAGAVVVRNVPDGSTVYGPSAKVL